MSLTMRIPYTTSLMTCGSVFSLGDPLSIRPSLRETSSNFKMTLLDCLAIKLRITFSRDRVTSISPRMIVRGRGLENISVKTSSLIKSMMFTRERYIHWLVYCRMLAAFITRSFLSDFSFTHIYKAHCSSLG